MKTHSVCLRSGSQHPSGGGWVFCLLLVLCGLGRRERLLGEAEKAVEGDLLHWPVSARCVSVVARAEASHEDDFQVLPGSFQVSEVGASQQESSQEGEKMEEEGGKETEEIAEKSALKTQRNPQGPCRWLARR